MKLLPTVLLLLAGIVAPVRAKSVDLSAHFDSEAYWSRHAIYLARITDCTGPSTPNGPYTTTFVPIQILAGTVAATSRILASYPDHIIDGEAGDQPENFPQGVGSGTVILASEDVLYHQIMVVRVMQFPADQAYWWEL
jgi:hypothetical protein